MRFLFLSTEDRFVNGREDIIYHIDAEDSVMKSCGIMFCGVFPMLVNGNKCNVILHDSAFEKMPENVQRMFVEHEIGHIMNGDTENISLATSLKYLAMRMIGIIPNIELKADEYAAKQIGYAETINAFSYVIKHVNLPLISKLEVIRRRNHLKRRRSSADPDLQFDRK